MFLVVVDVADVVAVPPEICVRALTRLSFVFSFVIRVKKLDQAIDRSIVRSSFGDWG